MFQTLLLNMPPEMAHAFALTMLRYAPQFLFKMPQKNPITLMGLEFPHRIGLAAGLDKNGAYVDALARIGFAFIEIGTVTPKPQSGNPKPRLRRMPESKALLNRMGFNNVGVDAMVMNLKKMHYTGILGINIGKNKDTPLNQSIDDYVYCLERVYPYASYITVNISSPNTPHLRQLQQGAYFDDLLTALSVQRKRLMQQHRRRVPLVIKISPDESDETLKQMAQVMLSHKIDGVIATNTTLYRHQDMEGGLSGAPLASRANHCLSLFKQEVGDALCLIGSGGVTDVVSAQNKIKEGANLIQVYTGLIYHGPKFVHQLTQAIAF